MNDRFQDPNKDVSENKADTQMNNSANVASFREMGSGWIAYSQQDFGSNTPGILHQLSGAHVKGSSIDAFFRSLLRA